ncbi:MAG: hypothetical protein E6K03_01365 [Methanobacteriota archaeon]|nr:MAG: hypothetical protein E6K03_01365 [Euryarchaeota archaeon]
MYEGKPDQFAGKLVRIRLQRGVLKVLVGVFPGEDSESIRISELYSYDRFPVRVVPKAQIAAIQTLDLTTGNWPEE